MRNIPRSKWQHYPAWGTQPYFGACVAGAMWLSFVFICTLATASSEEKEICSQYESAMKLINVKEGNPKFEEAARILRSAALANEPQSQYALGTLYLRGWGVERDPATGYAWLLLSAQPGDKRMKVALRDLGKKLGPEVTHKGTSLSESFRSKLSSPLVRCPKSN